MKGQKIIGGKMVSKNLIFIGVFVLVMVVVALIDFAARDKYLVVTEEVPEKINLDSIAGSTVYTLTIENRHFLTRSVELSKIDPLACLYDEDTGKMEEISTEYAGAYIQTDWRSSSPDSKYVEIPSHGSVVVERRVLAWPYNDANERTQLLKYEKILLIKRGGRWDSPVLFDSNALLRKVSGEKCIGISKEEMDSAKKIEIVKETA